MLKMLFTLTGLSSSWWESFPLLSAASARILPSAATSRPAILMSTTDSALCGPCVSSIILHVLCVKKKMESPLLSARQLIDAVVCLCVLCVPCVCVLGTIKLILVFAHLRVSCCIRALSRKTAFAHKNTICLQSRQLGIIVWRCQ